MSSSAMLQLQLESSIDLDFSNMHVRSKGAEQSDMSNQQMIDVVRQVARAKDEQGDDGAFFLMEPAQVARQFEQWRRMLPNVRPYYAVKCNNDATLLRQLGALGCGFDCASKNEIAAVLALKLAAFEPSRDVVFANPCKTRNFIRYARDVGVDAMTFDNEEELLKIAALFPSARLILRIAVSDPTAICQLGMKFGCDPCSVAPLLLRKAAELQLFVVGISFHVGSGCRSPAAFAEAIEHAGRLFDLGERLGHEMSILDIGGGFPGFPSVEITFEQIADVINTAIEAYFAENRQARPVTIIAEPGRFFATAAYSLCCNVIAKTKVPVGRLTGESGGCDFLTPNNNCCAYPPSASDDVGDGFMYYINDGVYGSFNCVLYDHYQPIGRPLLRSGKNEAVTGGGAWSSIWGPTCDGLDLVVPKCRLEEVDVGEWILFENMGAYTLAAGSEFNGFERPAVFYTDRWFEQSLHLNGMPTIDYHTIAPLTELNIMYSTSF